MIQFFKSNYIGILSFNLIGLNTMDSLTTYTFLKYQLAQEGNIFMKFLMDSFGVGFILSLKVIFMIILSMILYYMSKDVIHKDIPIFALCLLNIDYAFVVIWNLGVM